MSKKQRYKIVEVERKEKGAHAKKYFIIYRKRWFGWELSYGRYTDGEPRRRYKTAEYALKAINIWHKELYDDYYTKAFNKEKLVKEIVLDKEITNG